MIDNADDEVATLRDFIKEGNLGIKINIPEKPSEKGTMSGLEFLPILELVLDSSTVATTVSSLFILIKQYFDYKKFVIKTEYDYKKKSEEIFLEEEQSSSNTKKKKKRLKISSNNPAERKQIIKIAKKVFSEP